jgi:hypothetical protein
MDLDPRHPGTDPDPGKLNGYLRFRIRNTAQWFAKMSSVLPRLVARLLAEAADTRIWKD